MVQYISYRGKKYPIRVSYYVLKHLKEETGKGLEAIDDQDFEVYEAVLFYALIAGNQFENGKMESPIKREEMEMVLDECFFDFIEKIPKFFPDNNKKGGASKNKPAVPKN
jgi:hypothetical protein